MNSVIKYVSWFAFLLDYHSYLPSALLVYKSNYDKAENANVSLIYYLPPVKHVKFLLKAPISTNDPNTATIMPNNCCRNASKGQQSSLFDTH